MGAREHNIAVGRTAVEDLSDALNMLLTSAVQTGEITPQQMSDLLLDAIAQTMVMAVAPGRMEESINLLTELLRTKVYKHVQRMAHMRTPKQLATKEN
jgi:hypothetical protein